MRRWWRGSSDHGVAMKASTMASASSRLCMRPPMPISCALLCWRASWAVSTLHASAHRAPGTLLAAICSPLPLPPRTMPRLPGSATVRRAASSRTPGSRRRRHTRGLRSRRPRVQRPRDVRRSGSSVRNRHGRHPGKHAWRHYRLVSWTPSLRSPSLRSPSLRSPRTRLPRMPLSRPRHRRLRRPRRPSPMSPGSPMPVRRRRRIRTGSGWFPPGMRVVRTGIPGRSRCSSS